MFSRAATGLTMEECCQKYMMKYIHPPMVTRFNKMRLNSVMLLDSGL